MHPPHAPVTGTSCLTICSHLLLPMDTHVTLTAQYCICQTLSQAFLQLQCIAVHGLHHAVCCPTSPCDIERHFDISLCHSILSDSTSVTCDAVYRHCFECFVLCHICHQAHPALSGIRAHCFGYKVYHTEAGTRHKFFRVYPYVKQLRRWIKNKRKEQSSNKQPVAASPGNSNARSSQLQRAHKQQIVAVPPTVYEVNCESSHPEQSQQCNSSSSGLEVNTGTVGVPMPAPVTHCSVPEQPGQAWLHFTLNREQVLQRLTFPAVPQTAH